MRSGMTSGSWGWGTRLPRRCAPRNDPGAIPPGELEETRDGYEITTPISWVRNDNGFNSGSRPTGRDDHTSLATHLDCLVRPGSINDELDEPHENSDRYTEDYETENEGQQPLKHVYDVGVWNGAEIEREQHDEASEGPDNHEIYDYPHGLPDGIGIGDYHYQVADNRNQQGGGDDGQPFGEVGSDKWVPRQVIRPGFLVIIGDEVPEEIQEDDENEIPGDREGIGGYPGGPVKAFPEFWISDVTVSAVFRLTGLLGRRGLLLGGSGGGAALRAEFGVFVEF